MTDEGNAERQPPDGICLLLGSLERVEGWVSVNIVDGPEVDMVADIRDLSAIADASCSDIYASHVLEHISYKHDLKATLRGFVRILKPGGRLRVSVPDLDVLSAMLISPALSPEQKFLVMRMMFGGHINEHDYHQTGFNMLILSAYLEPAGFAEIRRVKDFGLFRDSSTLTLEGIPISLNVEAWRPLT